ncbi:hypothetical protein G6F31_020718 [Rhizopus arrhizus]|nr:hypothetical protein G6F31_020718 [Rhizopus arrhizus]
MKTGSRTTTAIVPTMIATVRPRKPNAINPNTTPPPMAAQISKKTAMAPVIGSNSKRTMVNSATAASTDATKARLFTRSQ